MAYNNSGDGFHVASNAHRNTILVNCIATANTGDGFYSDDPTTSASLFVCAGHGNSMNHTTFQVYGFHDLTADPFVAAASGNFALNATMGGGLELRSKGVPGSFPNIPTTGYLDIGAAQHRDAGSASNSQRIPRSRLFGRCGL